MPPKLTNGFATVDDLADHFKEHGSKLGAATVGEYERMADAFLGGLPDIEIMECRRAGGDMIRFRPATGEFGVISQDRVIRTYYIADPLVHRQATNLAYFQRECRKTRR